MRSVHSFCNIGNRQCLLWSIVILGLLGHMCALASGAITINTDTLTISDNGVLISGSLNGTSFSTGFRPSDGAAQFIFQGDLNLAGEAVTFVGSRAASFVVTNNANLVGASFDLSANGYLAGGGGGGYGFDGGADGGGLVILVAPIITLGTSAIITADGEGKATNDGAGGGGAIILVTPTGGLTEAGGSSVAAAAGNGSAGDGGAGFVERLEL